MGKRKLIIGLILAIAVLLVGCEVGARIYATHELRAAVATRQDGKGDNNAKISFSKKPLLLSLFTGTVDQVNITTQSTLQITYPNGTDNPPEIKGFPTTDMEVFNVNLRSGNVGVLRCVATIPISLLKAEATGAESNSMIKVTDLTSNPEQGVINIELNNGLANLAMVPGVKDHQLTFNATSASLLGFQLPKSWAEKISSAITEQSNRLTTGLAVDNVQLFNDSLRITLVDHDFNINQATSQP